MLKLNGLLVGGPTYETIPEMMEAFEQEMIVLLKNDIQYSNILNIFHQLVGKASLLGRENLELRRRSLENENSSD